MTRIVFSGESIFHTSGVANKHNARVWGTENPRTVQEVPSISEKVMIWCGMYESRIIDPYFFSELSVTVSKYKRILRCYGLPKIQELPGGPVFQQAGARADYSISVRQYLDRKFVDDWIGRVGPTTWPPC